MISEFQQNCVNGRIGYEQVMGLMDLMWPIYEASRYMRQLFSFFRLQFAVMRFHADLPADQNRLFGRFFRVSFFGKAFGDKNGKIYIYREKGMTHLYELTERLAQEYQDQLGRPIEIIKESNIDVSKLDPDLCYIQLRFVEPYFSKGEQQTKTTAYDRSHGIRVFYFDTPFTKTGTKVQGSVEQQWIRRTLLTVEHAMPSIVKVEEVKPSQIQEREFAPIRVSYRMLRDRVAMMQTAVESLDYRQVQQLLHGSLLVQVNEGPAKIAEAFLTGGDDLDPKYVSKLRTTFREFLVVCKSGCDAHRKWVQENQEFRMLQEELDVAFENLKDGLERYLEPEVVKRR
jgi:hypothetical protein